MWISSWPKRRLNAMCCSFERVWPRKTTTMLSWNAAWISAKAASSIGPDRSKPISAPSAASHLVTGIGILRPIMSRVGGSKLSAGTIRRPATSVIREGSAARPAAQNSA
jgi:hypothetical protein